MMKGLVFGLLIMIMVTGLFVAGCGKKTEPAKESQASAKPQVKEENRSGSVGEEVESNAAAEPEPAESKEIALEDLKAPDGSQAGCPVTGGKLNKDIWCIYNGMRIYFENAEAQLDFEGDPEKYVRRLKDAGVNIEQAQ
ncbi:MAG TPA: hypothetical protein PKH07_05815 [bacterium]|nr:hypothetical protein [bacterium]